MTRPFRWLCALHFVGNAALLGLGYWWLSVGESTQANLALSIALLMLFAIGATWLHGTSLAYFRDPQPAATGPMLRGPLRRILPLLLLAVVTAAIYFSLDAWRPLDSSRATDVASYLTLKTQTPVRPAAVQRVFDVLWWAILWAVVPTLLIPLASGAAALGWRGYREFGVQWRNWRYWLMAPALLVCAVWVPLALVGWKPGQGDFNLELTSLAARLGLAYLLFVVACLLLALVTSRGRPSLNQPNTVPSP